MYLPPENGRKENPACTGDYLHSPPQLMHYERVICCGGWAHADEAARLGGSCFSSLRISRRHWKGSKGRKVQKEKQKPRLL